MDIVAQTARYICYFLLLSQNSIAGGLFDAF